MRSQEITTLPRPIEVEPDKKTTIKEEPLPSEWNFPLPKVLPDPKG